MESTQIKNKFNDLSNQCLEVDTVVIIQFHKLLSIQSQLISDFFIIQIIQMSNKNKKRNQLDGLNNHKKALSEGYQLQQTNKALIQKKQNQKMYKQKQLKKAKEYSQNIRAQIANNLKKQGQNLSLLEQKQQQSRKIQSKLDEQYKYKNQIQKKENLLTILNQEKSRLEQDQKQMTEKEKEEFKTKILQIKEQRKKQIQEQESKKENTNSKIYNEKVNNLDYYLKLALQQIESQLVDQQFKDQKQSLQDRYKARLNKWTSQKEQRRRDSLNKLKQDEQKRKQEFEQRNIKRDLLLKKEIQNKQKLKAQELLKADEQFKLFSEQYKKSLQKLEQQKLQTKIKSEQQKQQKQKEFKQNLQSTDKINELQKYITEKNRIKSIILNDIQVRKKELFKNMDNSHLQQINTSKEEFQAKEKIFQAQSHQKRYENEKKIKQCIQEFFKNEQQQVVNNYQTDILTKIGNLKSLKEEQQEKQLTHRQQLKNIQQIYQEKKDQINQTILDLKNEFAERKEKNKKIKSESDQKMKVFAKILTKRYQKQKRKDQIQFQKDQEQQQEYDQRTIDSYQNQENRFSNQLKKWRKLKSKQQQQKSFQAQKVRKQAMRQIQGLEEHYGQILYRLSKYFELTDISDAQNCIKTECHRIDKELQGLNDSLKSLKIHGYNSDQRHLNQQKIKKKQDALENLKNKNINLINKQSKMKEKIAEMQRFMDAMISFKSQQKEKNTWV